MLRTSRPFATAARRATALRSGPTCPPPRAISTHAAGFQRVLQPIASRQSRQGAPPVSVAVVLRTQYSSKHEPPPVQPTKPDLKHEKELGKEKLEKDPSHVSIESSYRQDNPEPGQGERDVSEGVASDVQSIKQALSLAEVPREAYALGLAGTIPYFATSLATVYLSWNMRTPWPTNSNILDSIMLNNETAAQWLSHVELLQVGYGAAIISFLGAIHWGLEWAEKAPKDPRTRYRYAVGVLAPAVAWPTILLPVPFALTAQFGAFVALYFVDSRFTTKGWTPHWYGTYRFVLTAIVGGAIFVSLVFRSKGGEEGSRLSETSLDETMHVPGAGQAYSAKWAKLEEQEREKIKKEKEEEEKRKKKEEEEKKKAEKKGKGKGSKGDAKSKKGDEAKSSSDDGEDQSSSDDSEGKDEGKEEESGEDKAEGEDDNESDDAQKDGDDAEESSDESGDDQDDGDKGDKKGDAKADAKDDSKESKKGDEKGGKDDKKKK